MKSLVSVIIPNYNHARFLEERIQSVLNQTYQDFELIILDDCSPDDGASKAIIEQYRNNPHVSHIVYNDMNSGSTFRQWRKGIELAQGEYVWIAESDDSCDNRLLETLVGAIRGNNAVMAFCRSVRYDENGNGVHYDYQENLVGGFVLDGKDFIKEYLIEKNSVANASSVLFRKGAALVLDTQYTQIKAAGDWLFWILLAEKGQVCFINEELNYYRHHSTNVTKKSIQSGLDAKEGFVIYQYLVRDKLLTGSPKYAYRMNKVRTYWLSSFEKETKDEIMEQWDRYHVYRLLYPFYRLPGKIKELFEVK